MGVSKMVIAKRDLRRVMLVRRATLLARGAEGAGAAALNLPLGPTGAPPWVAGYRPMGSELDPGPLLARLAELGARILLPVVAKRGGPLVFREAGDLAGHVPDAAGILAPPPTALEAAPDLIIAPLLAFDRSGGRLGYGGGYYDRTVALLRAGPGVTVVGLAFSGQEVDNVPREPHDQRLDAICTESGYRRLALKDHG